MIRALKYLPLEQRAEKADGIAEIARAAPPQDLMMRAQDVHRLHHDGMTIGAHTVNHPILEPDSRGGGAVRDRARPQAARGHHRRSVRLFAYPNGKPAEDYGLRHVRLVRELGFDGAVTTAWGTARHDADPFQLPRFGPWDRQRWKYGLRLLKNLTEPATGAAQ